MKILANKEIKNLFLSLSLVFGVTFLLAEVFLWLSYRRLSLLLLILFLLAGGAVWAVCFVYFNRQNQDHGAGEYYKSMRILMVIAMPVLNVTMRANCTDCFIPSIL